MTRASGFRFDLKLPNDKPAHRSVDWDGRSAGCAPDSRRGRRRYGPILASDGLTLLLRSFTFGCAVSHRAWLGPRRGAFPLHG